MQGHRNRLRRVRLPALLAQVASKRRAGRCQTACRLPALRPADLPLLQLTSVGWRVRTRRVRSSSPSAAPPTTAPAPAPTRARSWSRPCPRGRRRQETRSSPSPTCCGSRSALAASCSSRCARRAVPAGLLQRVAARALLIKAYGHVRRTAEFDPKRSSAPSRMLR